MPTIDVTEVLTDTDVAAQVFGVLRRQEIVNNFGESTVLVSTTNAVGSVQPKGDQSLMREDGYDVQVDSIVVVSTFRLQGVTKGANNTQYKPDIIVWQNNFYEVISPSNWSAFGPGFIEVEATSIHNIDGPALSLPAYVGQLVFTNTANSGYAHGAGEV
jgi:hypothetical protein